MLNSAVLALAASLVVGQAAGPSELQNVFAPLIGEWVYDGLLQEDVPDTATKGTPIVIAMEYRWALGRNAMLVEWSAKMVGKDVIQGMELVGWDAKAQKIIGRAHGADGSVEHNVWVTEGDTILCKTLGGADGKGRETAMTYVHSFVGKDVMKMQTVNRALDGRKLEDTGMYEYKRAK